MLGLMPGPARDEARLEDTRMSLIGRLADWGDRARWQQFFDQYWRLIYSVARRAGLHEAEAQDVVQETVLSVAKNVGRYDPQAGSFKGWLLQMTRWRITDQLRKRLPAQEQPPDSERSDATAPIDRLPGNLGREFEDAWDEEWRDHLLGAALERVKQQVKPKHFQVFDCAIRKQWPAAKIASELGVNIAQVYLIKHRLASLLKKELRAMGE
jgi:RNA polymerase sigma-70 factor (ECF subfamily)